MLALMPDWIFPSLNDILISLATAAGIMFAVWGVARVAGLRTFAKMSAFDFASTVAVGSIMASTIMSNDAPLLRAAISIAAVVAVQTIVGKLKFQSDTLEAIMENDPLLLMEDGRILDDNLAAAGVTRGDLISKLREANVIQLSEVKAVVFETTGDVSVLHGSADKKMDALLMEGVRRTVA